MTSPPSENSTAAVAWDGVEQEAHESDSLLGHNDDNDHHHHHGLLATITEGVTEIAEEVAENIQEAAHAISEGVSDVTHEIQEAAHTISEGVSDATHEIQEAVVEEVHHVQEALIEELHEADEGDVFFLEMSLTRNLSILPGDKNLTEAVTEAQDALHVTTIDAADTTRDEEEGEMIPMKQEEEQEEVSAVVKPEPPTTTTPLSAYLILVSAVIALSSIGPFLNLQKEVAPSMKIFWRMTGTSLFLFPMAVREVWYDGIPHLSYAQWCTFLLAAASYATMCIAFVVALDYTSVGNAVILANSQSLLLLAGKFCVGDSLLFLEGAGATVAFAGAVLCSRDHSSNVAAASDDAGAGLSTIFGDGLALISAIGGVFYLMFGKSLRSNMTVYVFMFLIMTVGSILALVFMLVTEQQVSFSRQIDYGIWGWMNTRPDRLPLEIAMVVVCNLMGAMGYVRAFKYFDNLVISVAALMEPVVATFIAYVLNVGLLPGAMGWIGNVLVAVGTLSVVYPTVDKKGGGGGH